MFLVERAVNSGAILKAHNYVQYSGRIYMGALTARTKTSCIILLARVTRVKKHDLLG